MAEPKLLIVNRIPLTSTHLQYVRGFLCVLRYVNNVPWTHLDADIDLDVRPFVLMRSVDVLHRLNARLAGLA